jgi:hypothetical protein
MIWKGFGRTPSLSYSGTGGTEENNEETSGYLFSVTDGIQTEHISNTSLQSDRYNMLLGNLIMKALS